MKFLLLANIPNVVLDPPLFGGSTQYMIDHATLSTWCHVGHHVDYSTKSNCFDPLGSQGLVYNELKPSPAS